MTQPSDNIGDASHRIHRLDALAKVGDLNTKDGVQRGFIDPFVLQGSGTRVRRTVRLGCEDAKADSQRSRWRLQRVVEELLQSIGTERERRKQRHWSRRRHTSKSDALIIDGQWINGCMRRRKLGVHRHDG